MAVTKPLSTTDARTLAQSLCERARVKLPAEISDIIATHFDKAHLLKICLLSKELHVQANAILYHDITLDFGEATLNPDAGPGVLLLRTLLTSKVAACNVRRLSLIGDPLSQWRKENKQVEDSESHYRTLTPPTTFFDFSSWTSKEIQVYKGRRGLSNEGSSLPMLCLDITGLLTKLQYLQINSDYFRYSEFSNGLRSLVISGGLQNLEVADLCSDLAHGFDRHIYAVRGWESTLLAFFSVANSIKVVLTLQPNAMSQLRVSSLTRLILRHSQDGTYNLDALLAATPQLRYLDYHAWVDYGWYDSFPEIKSERPSGLEPLFDALKHVSNTLESLTTSQRVLEDAPWFSWGRGAIYERPFHLPTELSKLRRLSQLTIPYASLLGWECKEEKKWDWDRIWDQILPTSLRDITWTDHLSEFFSDNDWSDETLLPVISSLLDWMVMQRQGLETLKFGLFLPRSSDEFNEPERTAIHQLCTKHSITCAIKKRNEDVPKDHADYTPPGRGRRCDRGYGAYCSNRCSPQCGRGWGRGRGRGRLWEGT